MSEAATWRLWRRVDRAEQAICLRVNRGCRREGVRRSFVFASWLGNGPLWYALMAAIALGGGAVGALHALQMAVAGTAGAALYRVLKQRLVRERPFVSHAGIVCGTAPLDRYSFPSGHTLHAVCFTILAITGYPILAPVLVPLAAVIALSRVALGLHYPTDVMAGALIGAAIATATLALWPI